jgi:hypothetical protein
MGEQMEQAKTLNAQNISLYQDKEELNIQSVAPFIFQYESRSEFSSWLFKEGWGNAWGIFIISGVDMDQIQSHFRGFNKISKDDGTKMYFRYYDPRVLRVFLRNYDAIQLSAFFGPVDKCICEDEDPAMALIFSFDGRRLNTEQVAAGSIFSEIHKTPSNEDSTTNTSVNAGNMDSVGKMPGWFTK